MLMLSVPKGEIMCQDILELFLLVIKIELAASESHNNSLFSFCASFTKHKGKGTNSSHCATVFSASVTSFLVLAFSPV